MLSICRHSGPIWSKCPHYFGMYNNTCQWRSLDDADSFKFGMPYDIRVTAVNRLGSAASEVYTAQSTLIGMWFLDFFALLLLLLLAVFVELACFS